MKPADGPTLIVEPLVGRHWSMLRLGAQLGALGENPSRTGLPQENTGCMAKRPGQVSWSGGLMRGRRLLVMTVIVALVPVGAARGGSADDPEITDGCGDRPIIVEGDWPPPWLDTDKAWMSGDADEIVLTMAMCADTPPAVDVASTPGGVQGAYWFGWDVDGCVQRVRVEGPPLATEATFRQTCGSQPYVEVPIPSSDINVTGDVVQMTVRFEGDLAPFAFDFGTREEITLERPRTLTTIIVNHGQSAVEGESAGPGRNFVLRKPGS